MDMRTVATTTLNVYESETEPTLSDNEKVAFWLDTLNKKKYLIYKLGNGQIKVPMEDWDGR